MTMAGKYKSTLFDCIPTLPLRLFTNKRMLARTLQDFAPQDKQVGESASLGSTCARLPVCSCFCITCILGVTNIAEPSSHKWLSLWGNGSTRSKTLAVGLLD